MCVVVVFFWGGGGGGPKTLTECGWFDRKGNVVLSSYLSSTNLLSSKTADEELLFARGKRSD